MELTITGKKGVDIQEDLIGIFFEDINYAADGGIYAEMIENRSFEFVDASGPWNLYDKVFDGIYGWEAIKDSSIVPYEAEMRIHNVNPVNDINPHYLHIVSEGPCGFTNKAYDGIYVIENNKYNVSFYARTDNPVSVKIAAIKENEFEIFDEIKIECTDWKKYELTVTANQTLRHALFAVIIEGKAEVDFDCVSMFPEDAACGLFRKDLADKLKELRPRFIRFPGGCVVEGNELANRYQWKLSVGDITERKSNWNRWAVHGNSEENNFKSKFSHYNQTLGLGYYEYFMLCEYVGAKALPVVNVGLACQYMSTELVKREDPEYQNYIQDVLDLIEFANGDIDTKWGSLRAKMGHPKPFNLEMIGIGNEQWQTEQVDFFERYDDFEKAIHAVYPDMKLNGSAGPTVHTDTYEAAWKNIYEKANNNVNYTYAVDEHYYMEPEWFLNNTHFYDNYPRNVKVFSGEYAAHDKSVTVSELRNNWKCALSEAAFLTGVERNADVVYLASYAPLFARIGYVQWDPDMIWFNDKDSYASPNYYVQQLYSLYTGTETVESIMPEGEENGIFHVVSKDAKTGKTYVKLVNSSDKQVTINIRGFDKTSAKGILMKGELQDVNSLDKPENIKPVIFEIPDVESIKLEEYSFLIIEA